MQKELRGNVRSALQRSVKGAIPWFSQPKIGSVLANSYDREGRRVLPSRSDLCQPISEHMTKKRKKKKKRFSGREIRVLYLRRWWRRGLGPHWRGLLKAGQRCANRHISSSELYRFIIEERDRVKKKERGRRVCVSERTFASSRTFDSGLAVCCCCC